jgi:hypothetical protein
MSKGKVTLNNSEASHNYTKSLAFIIEKDCKKVHDNSYFSQITKQDIEDMDQLLKIESAMIYNPLPKKKRNWYVIKKVQ